MLAHDFAALDALLARLGTQKVSLQTMVGGASTRKYFRVTLAGGRTAVAMFFPQGVKTDEIQKTVSLRRWPFLEVAELLRAQGIRVPEVLGDATDRGWLLIEDLGDDTLAHYLLRHPDKRDAFYTKAVHDLALAQEKLTTLAEDCIVRSRAYDEELIKGEIDHFREWVLEARGHHLSPSDRETFERIAERMAERIAGFPRSFTHRDYQSRNLMVHTKGVAEPELVWIDFQDAMLGPRVYDLVALLTDSHQDFDRPFVEARLDEYAKARRLGAEERYELGRQFDWVTVQRKLKDAGRFVFIDRVNGNSSFLKFVGPTLGRIRASLARLAPHDEDMRALEAVLARAIPQDAT
ncbi:aminoglycoside phosphotransferase family protein [Pendulispora albinea]|uniref:Phosphotransferase n=1 Tax=Pendulispora albinea TaxID=2741071 RepID=A0ABZ2LU93_9BACT